MKTLMTVTLALMILLWAAMPGTAIADGDDPGRAGRVILVKCYLAVDGFGSFTANHLNTAQGSVVGLFQAGQPIMLQAVAAPGWEFTHWTFNGNYGGSSAQSSVGARIGLQIKAHFVKK